MASSAIAGPLDCWPATAAAPPIRLGIGWLSELVSVTFHFLLAVVLPLLWIGGAPLTTSGGCGGPRPERSPQIARNAARKISVAALFFSATVHSIRMVEGATRKRDIDALVALRDSQDAAVANALGWKGDPCAKKWKGVGCDREGRVVRLRVSGGPPLQDYQTWVPWDENYQPPLTGRIPPQLGNLSHLTVLDLSHNQLTGSMPPELGDLRRLTVIDLSNNSLTGSIPLEFGFLRDLKLLDLSTNNLSGSIPPQIGNLENLTVLRLSFNQLGGVLPLELSNCKNLESLDLYMNNIGGHIPRRFAKLRRLKELTLRYNRIRGSIPPRIGSLKNLTVLDLSYNSLNGSIPPQLGGLLQLENLGLASCNLTGSIPPQLGNLYLLVQLSLQNNSLEGPIPQELSNLTRLGLLDLGSNMLSGPVPPWLGNLDLYYLSLSSNNLGGRIPPELSNLSRLQAIDLAANSLVGPIPPELAKLKALVTLLLPYNNLTGTIPPELFNLSSLVNVMLGSNNLSGPIPPNVLNIRYLDLSSNSLSGEIPADLFRIAPGIGLDLSSNNLSGALPSNLSNWPADSNLANNYFRGPLPEAATNFSLGLNCFNMSEGDFHEAFQRDFQACAAYYPELSCTCPEPTVVGSNGSCYCVTPVRFDALFTCNNTASLGNFSINLPRTMQALAEAFEVNPVQVSPITYITVRSGVILNFNILPGGNSTEMSPEEFRALVNRVSNNRFRSSVAVPFFDPGIANLTYKYVAPTHPPPVIQDADPPVYHPPSSSPPPEAAAPAPGPNVNSAVHRGGGLRDWFIAGIVAVAVLVAVSAAAGVLFWLRPRFIYRPVSTTIEETSVKKWRLSELRLGTGNFDSTCILGMGGFATVYKADVGGCVMAVKRLTMPSKEGLEAEFVKEVQTIGHIHNRNLLQLRGYCMEDNEYLLVYDYMPNGSLEDMLFDRKPRKPLPWSLHVKILLGTARAVAYLHEGCSQKIIHRDIKPTNILLDANFVPHVADFGLVRSTLAADTQPSRRTAGTPGYLAPEYAQTGQLNEKSDVYSFGVVMLVMISHCQPIQTHGIMSLVERALRAAQTNRLLEIVHPHFQGAYDEEEAQRLISIALLCIQPSWRMRPSMGSVVQMLCGKADIPPLEISMDIHRPGFATGRHVAFIDTIDERQL